MSETQCDLIGQSNARERLPTPALILDLDHLEANLDTAAARAATFDVRLRPHIKGHKCPEIARLQLQSGAIGLSCATIAEADVAVAAGARSVLLTSPISPNHASRVAEMALLVEELILVVDNPIQVAWVANVANLAGKTIAVLCDLDVGQRRTGLTTASAMVAVAERIAGLPLLRFTGIQGYYGHLQGMQRFEERKQAAAAAWKLIAECVTALTSAGLPPEIVSGGGTGTFLIDLDGGPFTELQIGSYVFLDNQYLQVEMGLPEGSPFAAALFVRGHVVSANQPDRVTVNVGMKALSVDGGPPALVRPDGLHGEFRMAGDEHGFLFPDVTGSRRLQVGDAVEFIPSHCDTTTNLHDCLYVFRRDRLEAIWRVRGRGRWC